MRPDRGQPPNDRPPRTGQRLDLFYFERSETPSGAPRYNLRLTRLAAFLILGLSIAAMAGIVFVFLSGQSSPRDPAPMRVVPPQSTPFDAANVQVIKPLPPPRLPTPQPTRARSSPTPAAVDPATNPVLVNPTPSPEGRNRSARRDDRGRATPERPGRE